MTLIEDIFFHTKLDSRFTKSLFKYLNENQSIIDEVIVDTTLINSDQFIETLLSLKDFTKLHSVDTYRNLSFHFNDSVEILNIEKRLKKLNLKSDRIFAIMPYLQSFILNYSSFDNLLETIEKRLEIPVTSDSIIKQNLALLLNRLPNALEGGRINSQRFVF